MNCDRSKYFFLYIPKKQVAKFDWLIFLLFTLWRVIMHILKGGEFWLAGTQLDEWRNLQLIRQIKNIPMPTMKSGKLWLVELLLDIYHLKSGQFWLADFFCWTFWILKGGEFWLARTQLRKSGEFWLGKLFLGTPWGVANFEAQINLRRPILIGRFVWCTFWIGANSDWPERQRKSGEFWLDELFQCTPWGVANFWMAKLFWDTF